jgi:hypothetical protein
MITYPSLRSYPRIWDPATSCQQQTTVKLEHFVSFRWSLVLYRRRAPGGGPTGSGVCAVPADASTLTHVVARNCRRLEAVMVAAGVSDRSALKQTAERRAKQTSGTRYLWQTLNCPRVVEQDHTVSRTMPTQRVTGYKSGTNRATSPICRPLAVPRPSHDERSDSVLSGPSLVRTDGWYVITATCPSTP